MTQRIKRERSRERTPPRVEERPRKKTPPPAAKDVHSGSEEGEIEED
jgi:pre-mRNA-processing factor 40